MAPRHQARNLTARVRLVELDASLDVQLPTAGSARHSRKASGPRGRLPGAPAGSRSTPPRPRALSMSSRGCLRLIRTSDGLLQQAVWGFLLGCVTVTPLHQISIASIRLLDDYEEKRTLRPTPLMPGLLAASSAYALVMCADQKEKSLLVSRKCFLGLEFVSDLRN